MIRALQSSLIILLFLGCSTGRVSYYLDGDLQTRRFLDHVSNPEKISGDYFEVKRNDKGQITSAKYYSLSKRLIYRSNYTYNRKGQLLRHHLTEFFDKGPPRIAKAWEFKNGRMVKREEKWFTRARTLEKKLTVHYDDLERAYLEETWGLGNKIASSTEFYYDYKKRLDKSRRNFFNTDGSLRDYWLSIYNDHNRIINDKLLWFYFCVTIINL